MLNRLVNILSCDTGDFYSNREKRLHNKIGKLRYEKNELKKLVDEFYKAGNILEQQRIKSYISIKNELIKQNKNMLTAMLKNKCEINIKHNGSHHKRKLREENISDANVISVFDSFLIRTLGIKQNEFSEDFMVVQVFYFDIAKDIIYNGFYYKGEKYIYFTSSAGQIRTKKLVFIKESRWLEHQKTLMCGLTIDDINNHGGNNPNKHLAYLALTNSATDVWEKFDIDKTIVIDDFETNVSGTFDFVDDTDYSITRKTDTVPIPHTDGSGMILPYAFGVEQKNKMIRLPWVKGLLGVFDFIKFINHFSCSPIIKDIYGKEHDVIKENIQVIFTKSQFKTWKLYNNWEQYKEFYKMYHCTAGITHEEPTRFRNSTINYQMLQTLTDITDDEIMDIAGDSIYRLDHLCSTLGEIKSTLKIIPSNTNQTSLQKSIELYPNLLNDKFIKDYIRDIKNNMVNGYRSGRLEVNGKYTFVLPDFYAACEYWFLKKELPDGLLDDGEVFANLFKKSLEIDCLRSPHLYKEHAIRKNVASYFSEKRQAISEWFITNGIYTSSHDLISKVLMFDVDGDELLLVPHKKLIEVAKRNQNNIVPLYYNMRKAQSMNICPETIYNGLKSAFTGGNIGMYSNAISKIWNNDIFQNGSDEDKNKLIALVKILCMQNNEVIDYAKTLYKSVCPEDIKKQIAEYTNVPLPHFFKFAKEKEEEQITKPNNSFVNKLYNIIPNPRINTRGIGLKEIDYKMLIDKDVDICFGIDKEGKIDLSITEPLIVKYYELSNETRHKLNILKDDASASCYHFSSTAISENIVFHRLSVMTKYELSKFGYSDSEIVDILVKHLYSTKNNKHKKLLWCCYGDIIYQNLRDKIKPVTKETQCVDCGEWFYTSAKNNSEPRCDLCKAKRIKEYKSDNNKKNYIKRNC